MTDLWIASNNAKKRDELERLLGPLGYSLRRLAEAPGPVAMREDAPDFAGNAAIKARALARAVAAPAIGDDSGLCVDALDGRPGVLSARYGGEGATDDDRVRLLLEELHGVPAPRRTARFVCHLCLAAADGRVLAAIEESCEGRIATAPRGRHGFGYDPVFVPDAAPDSTFAELDAGQKDALSHRGKALRQLLTRLAGLPL